MPSLEATPLRTPLLVVSAAVLSAATSAQTPRRVAVTPAPHPAQLPITRVSLYKNGVGFFEHAGRVTGTQSVTIDFTSAQLNDVLQTLTVLDLNGGRIASAAFNSTTPIDQQLKALPLGLGEMPTSDELYETLRGARVEVHTPSGSLAGRILAVEIRITPASATQPAAQPATERHLLTIASDLGDTRTFELTPATTVRLLDAPLRADLTRYLELLDRNRSQCLRHLTLSNQGTGTRDLRISYLSEVPIWKSTYRILFTDPAPAATTASGAKETATLQGWSVVDNTTGEDWTHVHLSLIAGSPQSFLQPLSQPIYSRRPEIPIAEDAQLTPQTHDSGERTPQEIRQLKEDSASPRSAGVAGMAGLPSGSAGGVLGGIGSGSGGNAGGGSVVSKRSSPVNGRQIDRLSNFTSASSAESVSIIGAPYEQIATASLNPNATTAAFDDYFAYNLTDPVSIPKNQSALVPILQTTVASERVTLWNPQQPQPLRALWITNTSPLTLDRGSFTIVENGSFGGEGLLETIHPNEHRLLSYAVDQAVRVSVDQSNTTQRVQRLTVSRGVLTERSSQIAEVEYLVHNAAAEPRLVIVEQPRRQGWSLDSAEDRSSDPKPAETTPTVYRFRVLTAPGETVRLHLGERLPLTQKFRLVDDSDEQLTQQLRGANASPALLAQLEPVFAARRTLASLETQIMAKQHDTQAIMDDQKRLRDNLSTLRSTPDERALSKRYTAELNSQEDTLASLRRDLASLETQRTAARQELSHQIDTISAEEERP